MTPRPAGDGLSWDTAYRLVQDALLPAKRPAPDPQACFLLPDGVTLVGGFAGIGAADPDERDVDRFASTLTGGQLGNDGPDP